MERIDINSDYSMLDVYQVERANRKEMGDLPIHEFCYSKYVKFISLFPFNKKKEIIFKSLNPKQKLGMLNRHVLSVAKNLEISQIIIKKAKEESLEYRRCIENIEKYSKDDFWVNYADNHRKKMEEYYQLILDMIIEEMIKRTDVKYMRKKKLKEILTNNDN